MSKLGLLLGWTALLVACSQRVEDRFRQGMDMVFEGHYEDAESFFLMLSRELTREPSLNSARWQAQCLYQAARLEHLYLGQPKRAVARFREGIKTDPQASFLFDALKEIASIELDLLKDYRAAILDLGQLVQSFPQNPEVGDFQYQIAQSYFLLREFELARTEARSLLQKIRTEPIAVKTRLLVANSFYVEGRYEEAVQAHIALLASNPAKEIESRSRFELGMCYQETGDFRHAEENLLIALKQHPQPILVQQQLNALHKLMADAESTGPSQRLRLTGLTPAPLSPKTAGGEAMVKKSAFAPAPREKKKSAKALTRTPEAETPEAETPEADADAASSSPPAEASGGGSAAEPSSPADENPSSGQTP